MPFGKVSTQMIFPRPNWPSGACCAISVSIICAVPVCEYNDGFRLSQAGRRYVRQRGIITGLLIGEVICHSGELAFGTSAVLKVKRIFPA